MTGPDSYHNPTLAFPCWRGSVFFCCLLRFVRSAQEPPALLTPVFFEVAAAAPEELPFFFFFRLVDPAAKFFQFPGVWQMHFRIDFYIPPHLLLCRPWAGSTTVCAAGLTTCGEK